MDASNYRYFNRDLSWLSFNYRVLLEAKDERLPVYERIKFLSIYSSNLEEFYKVRVSRYHNKLLKSIKDDEATREALQILTEINKEVTTQEEEYDRIFTTAYSLNSKEIVLFFIRARKSNLFIKHSSKNISTKKYSLFFNL